MNKEEIKEICKEQFKESIMTNLDSALIFEYIRTLERENTNLKQALVDIKKYINETSYAFNYDGSHCRLKDSEHSKRILQIIDKALGDDE